MVTTKVENSAAQLSAAANIRNVWGSLFINVKAAPYNAKGDGVTDDTAAIQAAINDAAASGVVLYITKGKSFYNLTNTLTIPKAMQIRCEPMSELRFTLATDIPALKFDYAPDADRGYYEFGHITSCALGSISSTYGNYTAAHDPKNGTAIFLDSMIACEIKFYFIYGFKIAVHLQARTTGMYNNIIDFGYISNCGIGLLLETVSSLYPMEGNIFRFNFITEVQNGIYFKIKPVNYPNPGDLVSHNIALNEFYGGSIHGTRPNGWGIYTENDGSADRILGNTIQVRGYLDASSGLIGGNFTYLANPGYANFRQNSIEYYITASPQTRIIKYIGPYNRLLNGNEENASHLSISTGYSLPTTPTIASFNGGIPASNNLILCDVSLVAAAAGTVSLFYGFSYLLGNGGKPIEIIPVNGDWFTLFNSFGIDETNVEGYRFKIAVNYIQATAVTKTLSFYVRIA